MNSHVGQRENSCPWSESHVYKVLKTHINRDAQFLLFYTYQWILPTHAMVSGGVMVYYWPKH